LRSSPAGFDAGILKRSAPQVERSYSEAIIQPNEMQAELDTFDET
jgi:hypothetical protein